MENMKAQPNESTEQKASITSKPFTSIFMGIAPDAIRAFWRYIYNI